MTSRPRSGAIFAGGGTAGHVLPGIAVARALVARGADPSSLHFVVSERGSERALVDDAGFPCDALPGRGIQRKLSLRTLADNLGADDHTTGLLLKIMRDNELAVVSPDGAAMPP